MSKVVDVLVIKVATPELQVVDAPVALNAAPSSVSPVPPFATGNAVPEYVIANVPEVVIGEPEILKILGTVAATLVTVPDPLLLKVVQSVLVR